MNGPAVHILLVEPDPAAALLMREAMSIRAADFVIHHSATLADAFGWLPDHPTDIALVELNLPDSQGLATLASLLEATPGLPIVVLTTIADEDLAITAIQQGAQDYLIKESVHYALLSRSIRYAIERKRIEIELVNTKQAALAASTAKSEFLAHMSHEIRSPLASIVSYADALLDLDLPAADRRAALTTIRRNGVHLLAIVNDILDISKIESRKFEVERVACSPAAVVHDVLEMLQVRARAKGLALDAAFQPGLPAAILSDPLRLKQILVNLVSNGVKFTERGEVRVTARMADEGRGEPLLEVSVTDTGIGITSDQCQKLFVAYQQSEVWTAREFGGTGLGLAISRELARKLGGDISVHSQPGRGSTFTVRVSAGTREDLRKLNETPTVAYRTTMVPLEGRVLLAEDGPDNRRLLSVMLRKAGLTVELAEDGCQAVEMAQTAVRAGQPHDLVLMDMLMPVKDGYAATRELRARGYDRPIVALTANSTSGARQECLDAGCDDFASKPIDAATLLDLVRKWLPADEAARQSYGANR